MKNYLLSFIPFLCALNGFTSHFSEETRVHHVDLPEAEQIRLTFTVTTDVDICNSHLMGGHVEKLAPPNEVPHYNATFYIIGTEMFCKDRTTKQETFSMIHYVYDREFQVEVPENVSVNAEAIVRIEK